MLVAVLVGLVDGVGRHAKGDQVVDAVGLCWIVQRLHCESMPMTSVQTRSAAACVMAALDSEVSVNDVGDRYRTLRLTDLVACFLALCSHVAASSEFLTRSRNESVDVRLLVVDVETSEARRADAGVVIPLICRCLQTISTC